MKRFSASFLINLLSASAGIVFAAGLAFGSVAGCRVQAGNPQSDKPVKPGTVTVALADAPIDDLTQIFVTVDAIAFAPAGTGPCLREPKRGCARSALYEYQLNKETEVDLLSLSDGRTQILPFSQDLSSGTYEGIRLFLAEDSKVEGILKNDGSRVEIDFPTSPLGRKEFTIIEEFEIQEGTDNQIIIHVDLRRSLLKKPDGRFLMMPMTNVVPSRIAARLFGTIADDTVTRVCAYNLAGKRRQSETYGKESPLRPPHPPPPHSSGSGIGPKGIPPQMDANDSCDRADAVSDPKNGNFDLRYLMPVPYTLRGFKSDGTYIDTVVSSPLRPQEERELAL